MDYKFTRRTHNLPENIQGKMSFEANSMLEALQLAADYWWPGAEVIDWIEDNNEVITLLDNSPNGNVIGTLMNY